MIRKFYIIIKKLLTYPKKVYKKAQFRQSAFFKDYTTVEIGPEAYCQNKSKSKLNLRIGENCDIHCRISLNAANTKVSIGDYTTIRGKSEIRAIELIEIGNFVIISNNVIISDNNNHPIEPDKRIEMCKSGFYSELWNWNNSSHKPIVIEDNVWIGEGATILKGVKIGKGSIVGCKSVVTKDVEPYSIVAGNTARKVKELKTNEDK